MSLEELISTYGYFAIAIGTFLEGETVLFLGGFSAHRGYLDLSWVLVIAFIATSLNGQILYYLGELKGERFLVKYPGLKNRSGKALALLSRHRILLILGFRFLYGMRTVTPLLLGAGKVPPIQFLILNLLGAFFWTATFGVMGYLFGHTLERVMGDIQRYETWLFAGIAVAGAVAWLIHIVARRRR